MAPSRFSMASCRAFVCLTVLAVGGGCQSWPWRNGAVPQSVADCREYSQRAVTCIDANRWQEAEDLLDRAIEACPVDPDARRQYADVLLQRGAMDEAVAQLEEAVRLTPHDTALVVRAGEVYYQAKRFTEARRCANEAINQNVRLADAWVLRGRIEQAEGHPRQALADLQRAIGYRPENPRLLSDIADLYMQTNRPERALLYLQNLSANYVAGEEPFDVARRQGEALVVLGRYQDAAVCYQAACHREPDSVELLYQLGQVEYRAGHIEQARAAMQRALNLRPDHQPSVEFLARLGAPMTAGTRPPDREAL